MSEAQYQAHIINRLEQTFPGCVVLKNDSSYRQGIPDLAVFYYSNYAMLEVKTSATAPEQPNQPYYVQLFGGWSFAAFIYPENEEEIFAALQRSFSAEWSACIS